MSASRLLGLRLQSYNKKYTYARKARNLLENYKSQSILRVIPPPFVLNNFSQNVSFIKGFKKTLTPLGWRGECCIYWEGFLFLNKSYHLRTNLKQVGAF